MEKISLGHNENPKDLPNAYYENNRIKIEGNSKPVFADEAFDPLFKVIEDIILTNHTIIVDFYFGFFNTGSSLIIHKILTTLTDNRHKCNPIVNYYVDKDDDELLEYGYIFKELNPLIEVNVNLL